MSQQIPLKIYYNNAKHYRKFSIAETTTFADFVSQFRKIVGANSEVEDTFYRYRIDYTDEVKDWIYLIGFEDATPLEEKELEWREAIHTGKQLGMLNLRIAVELRETNAGKQKRLEALAKQRAEEAELRRKKIEEHRRRGQDDTTKKQLLFERLLPHTSFFNFGSFGARDEMKPTEFKKKQIPIEEEIAIEKEKAVASTESKQEASTDTNSPVQQEEEMPTIETIPEPSSSNSNTLEQKNQMEQPVPSAQISEMDILKNMGFTNEKLNTHLLKQFNSDINQVVNSLLRLQHM